MKLDLAKLPVLEAVIAFLLITIVVTFAGAFAATDNNSPDEVVAESPTPGPSPSPGASPTPAGAIAITLQDNKFDPDEITVSAGSNVTFEITNDGSNLHNMHIAGQGGDYTEDFCEGGGDPCSDPNRIDGGEAATINWEVPPEPGEIDFRCDFHPREMTGTISIE